MNNCGCRVPLDSMKGEQLWKRKKKKFTFPTTATLLLIVVLVMGILTYIIPAGQFDREINEATGREGVVPGSFHYVEQSPVSVTQLFEAPYWGFLDVVDIIAVVFIIGGSMGVVIQSGAIHAGIGAIARRTGNRSDIIFVFLMLVFGAASTFLGMAEELIVFIPLLISISLSLALISSRRSACSCWVFMAPEALPSSDRLTR